VAVVLMIVSLLCSLAMDVVVHAKNTKDANCIFAPNVRGSEVHILNDTTVTASPLFQNVYFFTAQSILTSLFNMLMDAAVLEFVCSQSPYSMKGLAYGLFLLVKNFFQALTFVFMLPFSSWHLPVLSCGSAFFVVTIIIAILELMLFVYVAKKFKYRIVNEPSNEYIYAEEYYSNTQ